jgi:hypothetical protein
MRIDSTLGISMQVTLTVEQKIIELLRNLPVAKQKQILDFAQFIYSQAKSKEISHSNGKILSALDLAGDLIGSLDIGGDISLKKHDFKNQNLV